MRPFLAAFFLNRCGALVLNADVASNVSERGVPDQQLHVRTLVDAQNCLGGWNAINPSFAFVPGTTEVAVALRGLCLHKKDGHASWYSKMVLGTIPASDIRGGSRTTFHWKSLSVAQICGD